MKSVDRMPSLNLFSLDSVCTKPFLLLRLFGSRHSSVSAAAHFAVMGTSLRHLEACKSFGMMRLEDTSCRYVAALRTGLESRKRVGKPDSCPMLTMLIVTCLLETLGLFRVRLDARCFTMTERLRRVN